MTPLLSSSGSSITANTLSAPAMAVCICPYICASSSIGLPNCFAYTINADITPIDIIWFR